MSKSELMSKHYVRELNLSDKKKSSDITPSNSVHHMHNPHDISFLLLRHQFRRSLGVLSEDSKILSCIKGRFRPVRLETSFNSFRTLSVDVTGATGRRVASAPVTLAGVLASTFSVPVSASFMTFNQKMCQYVSFLDLEVLIVPTSISMAKTFVLLLLFCYYQ